MFDVGICLALKDVCFLCFFEWKELQRFGWLINTR